MPEPLPAGLLDLLRRPSPCFVATVMPDGSPQLTQTWVTTDGAHVVINIVEISQKYLGRPYPNFRGVPETRVIVTIEADSVVEPG